MALDNRNEKPIISPIINPTSARPSCRAFLFSALPLAAKKDQTADVRRGCGYAGHFTSRTGQAGGVRGRFRSFRQQLRQCGPVANCDAVSRCASVSGLIRWRACMPTQRATAQ